MMTDAHELLARQLAAENARLRAALANGPEGTLTAELAEAVQENERLRAALGRYADLNNWHYVDGESPHWTAWGEWHRDDPGPHDIARAALALAATTPAPAAAREEER